MQSFSVFNTLRPRQNGHHFADDIFKCIFLNENVWIPINISLKFVPKGQINNIPALVQIMAWRRPGDKPLSEPMMVSLPTHICVTRPQWVKRESILVCSLKQQTFKYITKKLTISFTSPCTASVTPFYLLQSQHGLVITCQVKLLHSHTLKVQPLKFGNGWIISSHTL